MDNNIPFILNQVLDHYLNNILIPLFYVLWRCHFNDRVLKEVNPIFMASSLILLDVGSYGPYLYIAKEADDQGNALSLILLHISCDIPAVALSVSGLRHVLSGALRQAKP